MWGIVIGLLSGVLMSVQGVFNTEVTKQSGVWMAAAFVQISAFLVCILAWLATGRDGSVTGLFHVNPKYMLLGGAIGAFITYTVIQAMEQCGPAKAVVFIVVAQIISAYIIEVFGWFGVEKQPFSWRSVVGLAFVIGGIITFKWK